MQCKTRYLLLALLALPLVKVHAAREADVRNTRHNLSATPPDVEFRTVKATEEDEICIFCHTPHGASVGEGPLWNRSLSEQTYTASNTYGSGSIQADIAEIQAGPGGTSKLCLSCHDGTLAIGQVSVADGQLGATFAMSGTEADGTMPVGQGETTGFTRRLGVDLSNDHPISFTYDSALATADGELRDPVSASHIDSRSPGVKPLVPLENGTMQCVTCHDPHIKDDAAGHNIKFLRLNRFQVAGPNGGSFIPENDIICLACHDKDKLGSAWSQSVHADPTVADETYKSGAGSPAELREFPDNIKVWEASCLNCHDTHTIPGARRLLREGTDALGGPSEPTLFKSGGAASIEGTCYQCHTSGAETILNSATGVVPDIESDFRLTYHMPITNSDQNVTAEVHDISDADFQESTALLGKGNLSNRHVECTDCHNPHRVIRNNLFNNTGSISSVSTHDPDNPTNIASGALRGTIGVEPIYGSNSFHVLPSGYTLKKGDGGDGASTAVTSNWVTREYQICMKCHSDYAYNDDNVYPAGSRPNLGDMGGTTPAGGATANHLDQYTNQAKEFQAPSGHRGEGVNVGVEGGASALDGNGDWNTNNHRSWHPVMDITGRDAATRGVGTGTSSPWEEPWRASLGNQTMYCTDCHGSSTLNGTREPTGDNPWGPHGSTYPFILKGPWNESTGSGQPEGLCFKCHRYDTYPQDGGQLTGFRGGGKGDLHSYHQKRIGSMRCTWCHVAVPHGWKNKAFLVNLNDVGPEAGLPEGTEVCTGELGWGSGNSGSDVDDGCSFNNGYTRPPYYLNAFLKIRNFATSGGGWSDDNCGTTNNSDGDSRGIKWMKDETCSNPN